MRPACPDSHRGCSMFRLPTLLVLTLLTLSFSAGSTTLAAQRPDVPSSSGVFRAFVSSADARQRDSFSDGQLRSSLSWRWAPRHVERALPFGRFASHRAYFGPAAYGIPFVPTHIATPVFFNFGPGFFLADGFTPQFAFGLGIDVGFALRVSTRFYGRNSYLSAFHDPWAWRFAGLLPRSWYHDGYRYGYRNGFRDGYRNGYWRHPVGRGQRYVRDPWRPGVGRTGSRGFWDAPQDWQRVRPRWGAESGPPSSRPSARPSTSPSGRASTRPSARPSGRSVTRREPAQPRPRTARPYLRPAPGRTDGAAPSTPVVPQRQPQGGATRSQPAGAEGRAPAARPRADNAGARAPRQEPSGQGRRAIARPRARPR